MKQHSDFRRKFSLLFFVLFILFAFSEAQTIPQYYNNVGGSSSNSYPLNSTTNNKAQWIYGPGVFHTSGTTGNPAPAGLISKVYFMIGTTTSSTAVYSNFTIKISQNVGTITAWADPAFVTGMDTAFYATTYSLVNPVTDQWQQFILPNPILYNPSLSLAFEICVSAGTGNAVRQQTGSTNQRRYGLYSATTGTINTSLLNIGFDLVPGNNDAGLEGFVNLPDSLCSGDHPITVTLKNHGPNSLSSAKINWEINNVVQPVYNWSGNLAVNQSAQVTIGNYTFATGTPYDVLAYSSDPNGGNDTVHVNDTIAKASIYVKPAPGITLTNTTYTVCPGDSVLISGTLTGTPPWNLIINDGTINFPISNIPVGTFGFYFTPATTTTFTITSVTDATGCENTLSPTVLVTLLQAPPAVITPLTTTACCMGDSVTLMASIGLNFHYQWLKDGVNLPGDTTYVLTVKQAGNFTVKITSPEGCSTLSAPTTIIVHPLPAVFLGNDTNLAPVAHITLDAGPGFNSYQWSTGATSQTLYVDTAGHGLGLQTIWVAVQDNNYCTGRDTIKINFVHNPGIAEGCTDATVQVIPNPTGGRFELHITGFSPGTMNLQLYSHESRLVYESSIVLKHPTERITVDPGKLPEGVYLLKLDRGQGTVIRRVVVSR